MPYRIKLITPVKKEPYFLRCGSKIREFDTEDQALNRMMEVLDFINDTNPLRRGYLSDLKDTQVEIEEFKKE